MAKQSGPLFIRGTIYDITFYKMYGTYYARMKSSLSRKKVLTSPRFALTRMHANQLANASQIASRLYKGIPKEERNMTLFRSFVGRAKVLLAEGKDKDLVFEILSNELFPTATINKPKQINQDKLKQRPKKRTEERAYVTKKGRLIWKEMNSTNPYLNIEQGTRNFELRSNVQYSTDNTQFSIERRNEYLIFNDFNV